MTSCQIQQICFPDIIIVVVLHGRRDVALRAPEVCDGLPELGVSPRRAAAVAAPDTRSVGGGLVVGVAVGEHMLRLLKWHCLSQLEAQFSVDQSC